MSTDPRTVVADYVAAVARGDADAVRDGRIAAVREYTDTHRAATVLFADGA
ncbi:hypothetical protein HUT16_11990 [Kitasatospora sp. NA04385]|uniref:hypothetical protein n=1 Tax=Kitasatospora sp. NA04385 TaxID=2742135 RepID=UPI001590B128|nr:hypothetical protein [Kitasatospora sp. NA04385]QKW19684.1 hypothetical protein HUT16_11990 [Kitasatospora sp. NA04385]